MRAGSVSAAVRSIAFGAVLILGAGQIPNAPAAAEPVTAPEHTTRNATAAAALPANPVDYAYDGAGQLRGVTQTGAGGASARYDYDDSGNLLSIARSPATALTVLSLAPSRAPAGTSVTIAGTGFATTAAGNTVRFNGTAATLTQASATRLVATVPAGATTGTVTVTTSSGTATSTQQFTVLPASPAPAISAVSPGIGVADTTVTISGSGFDPAAANNTVVFGATRAQVSAATATSLTVKVPAAATSGRVTVATPGGTATSGTDFVVVPRSYAAADVVSTGSLAVDGAAATVSVPTAGKVALFRFAGTKGQRLSLGLTGSSVATDLAVSVYSPYGATFGADQFERPHLLSELAGGLALPPLPTTGTYQVVIDPTGTGTGSVTATLSSRVVTDLSLTGAGSSVALNRAGQQAELRIPATAGQPIGLGFTGSTFAASTATVHLREPNGSSVLWPGDFERVLVGLGGEDLDFTPALTGTYTLLIGPSDAGTGTVTATASTELNAGPLTLGTPKTVSIGRPGQDARTTFTGTTGQLLSLDFPSYTFGFSSWVTVYAPDGSVLSASDVSTYHLDLPALPAPGTYAITISPYSSTGSLTAVLSERQNAGAVSSTGPAVTVSLTQPGRTADLGFTATAGQHLVFAFSSWTFPASGTLRAQIFDPAGTMVVSTTVFSLATFWFAAGAAGTYRLTLAPTDGTGTGSVAVTLSPELDGGTLAIGTAKTVSAARTGQSTRLRFTGTAGQRFSLSFGAFGFPHTVGVGVLAPDGSVFHDDYLAATQLDLDPLPVGGTYEILVYPFAETGSTQLTLVERVNAGTSTVGGATTALTVSQAGRYAETSFTATAGQRLSFGFTNWTFASGVTLRARVLDAQGGAVTDLLLGNGSSMDATAPAAGTYRLVVGPTNFSTGGVTLTLSQQLDAGTIGLNTAKTVTFGRAGQSARMAYAGTAGQNLALTFTGVTLPFYPSVTVLRPDGSTLTQNAGAATVNIATLPSTTTYQIILSPYSFTGAATVTLGTRAAALAAPVVPDGVTTSPQTSVPAFVAGRAPAKQPGVRPQGTVPLRVPAARARSAANTGTAQGGEAWTPDRSNLGGTDWDTHRPTVAGPAPQPRRAPAGTTAVSGRILTLDGRPLANVTTTVEGVRATSDANGQFLLSGLTPGHRVLRVDGRSASTPGRTFGLHDIGVELTAGQTTILPYTIWLSKLDTQHTVRFASPTSREEVITNPAIPGLEVRLPAGTVVRDVDGKVVTELGITAIPVDRAPFPLPRSQVPVYFTVQPGSATVFPAGATVVYPNYTHAPAGARMDFWHYDPAGRGWFVYGHGTVTPDARRVVPDKGTEVYQFTGAMLITPGYDPPPATAPVPGGGANGADPVDLGSGLLVDQHTDLTVEDVVPLALTRTYQQSDTGRRSFGIGVNSDYDLNLYSENRFVDCWVLLPDGGRVRYHRITPGSTGANDFLNAAFEADPTPTRFNKSILAWNGAGWDLRLTDGTTLVFGDESPLQSIRDRFGNTVTITRAPAPPDTDGEVRSKGPITQVTSPNGRWIKFTNDTANRITRAEDNSGRAVSYTYDGNGFLSTVTDANGGITTYTYESGRLKTIRDPRGTVLLTNEYDSAGRVAKQTLPDGTTYLLAYTTDSTGRVTEARLTDPRGNVRRVTFNAQGFTTTDTAAFGTARAQTTTVTRDPATNLATEVVDPLGRHTTYAFDGLGNLTGVTELAGTADARTTTFAYAGPFNQISRVTDPLGHAIAYGYQPNGALRTITDPLSRVTTMDTDPAGQVTKLTDNLGNATQFGYTFGDLSSVTDPLGRVATRRSDGAGRTVALTDAQGNRSTVGYDGLHVRTSTDPLGRSTALEYDANGNLTKVTDPRAHVTTYTYDLLDRVRTVTDPLGQVESRTYDGNGNLSTLTSRRGQVTAFDYDELDRLTSVRYAVSGATQESRTGYTYDAGNRVSTVVDSAGGTTTLTVDGFDRVTRSAGPQGTIDYAYDAADRRRTMTVSGQPAVTYTFDDADQLTQLVRGTDTVSIGYDGAGRRSTVTLPGGIVQTYGYDSASQVTDLTYTRSGTTLGNLTYAYSQDGHPVHVDGSFARGDVPAAYGPVTYDAANRIAAYTYDADGNLTSDGTASYTWNARGQLTGYSRTGLSLSFGYDGFGQRTSRTSGSTTTRYLYDGPNAVQELSGTTATANLLTGGVDEVFSRTTSAGTRSLLTDPLGSTIAVADTAGTVTGEYSYQPFGATTLSGDDAGNPSRFTGREDDGDGLYYYRSRYYSTATQRFVSEDPFGFAAGDTNLYAYVANQPTGLVDPYGTKPQGTGGSGPVDVTVRWTPGMPKNQFNIKARQLQELSDRGVLFKAPNPVARDSTITGRYKQQLIQRVFDQFGQTNRDFAEALRTRILTRMNPDHIWELQLGGPDELANLHILDAFTNQRIGTQIWTQIMHLPDYTPIRIIIIGP